MSTALAETQTNAPAVQNAGLPEPVARRGIDEAQWRTLMNSLFPGAKAESVLMVVDYCRARKLDPLKKPCHIVPMKVKDQKSGEWVWRDVVMPGIYEYRTTAMRTGKYLGHSKAEYGPMVEQFGVSAPEWCEMTIYRAAGGGERIEFPVRVYFREACATKFDKEKKVDVANDRWERAPIQMLTKVCEAAGLREAFPDEFGGEATAEEMDGRDPIDVTPQAPAIRPAQRISQTVAVETTAAAAPAQEATSGVATENAPAKAAEPTTPSCIGAVADVLDRSQGDKLAAIVLLDTGFKGSTRDAAVIGAATNLKGTGRRVELVTTPSTKDPAKYAPTITELVLADSGESTAS